MDIAPSLIKPKLTAHDLDLILDLGKHAEVVGENENVPAVFERCQQVERSSRSKLTPSGGCRGGGCTHENGRRRVARGTPTYGQSNVLMALRSSMAR